MKVVYLSQSDVERGRLVEVRGRLVSLFLLHLYLTQLLFLQSGRNSLPEQTHLKKSELKKNVERDVKSDSSESQTEKAERLKE